MRAGIKGALLIGILLTTIVGVVLHLALRLPLSTVPGKLEAAAAACERARLQRGRGGLQRRLRVPAQRLRAGDPGRAAGDALGHAQRLLRHGRHLHGAGHRGWPRR